MITCSTRNLNPSSLLVYKLYNITYHMQGMICYMSYDSYGRMRPISYGSHVFILWQLLTVIIFSFGEILRSYRRDRCSLDFLDTLVDWRIMLVKTHAEWNIPDICHRFIFSQPTDRIRFDTPAKCSFNCIFR